MSANAVIVSNAEVETVNGIYYFTDFNEGKEWYNQLGYGSQDQLSIVWGFNGNVWSIYDVAGDPVYESPEDVEFPWLVASDWLPTEFGTGDFTQVDQYIIPTEPTFGLPADVVALITSRFGTVANFLRLRNQGQI